MMTTASHTRAEWQAELRVRRHRRPGLYICSCAAGHCPESAYHDYGCCAAWCECFCHIEAGVVARDVPPARPEEA